MFNINGKLILKRIEDMGFSQLQFSKRIGTSQPTFSRMVNNKSSNVDLEVLYKISKILDVELNELIVETLDYKNKIIPNDIELLSHIEMSVKDTQRKIWHLERRLKFKDEKKSKYYFVAEKNKQYHKEYKNFIEHVLKEDE